jgi:hypothetical protein
MGTDNRGLSPVGILIGLLLMALAVVLILGALPAWLGFASSYGGVVFPLVVPWYFQLPAAAVTFVIGVIVFWVI